MAVITFLDAIKQGIHEEMRRDNKVFCIGEDIGKFGGAFKVTKGFLDEFGPDRVVETPISESAFIGFSSGAALFGLRPVIEIQFIDFIACGFNQIVNFAAKCRYRWGAGIPIVIRGPCGAGNRAGPFHSQVPEMWFSHTPGLKVVFPGTPYDAKGLIKSAIRDDDPVIFLEHKYLYRRIKDEVPSDDYVVPLGKANVVREGSDLTLVTYGAMLHTALKALETLDQEMSVEVIDLRTIYPLDRETIFTSVKKTSKLIVLHEDIQTGGIGGEIVATICENCFEYLDGPPVRITAPDTPVPQAPTMEDFYLPNVQDVIDCARKLAAY